MSRPNWSTLGVLPPLVLEGHLPLARSRGRRGRRRGPSGRGSGTCGSGSGRSLVDAASSASGSPGATSPGGESSGAHARARTTPRTRSARASRSRQVVASSGDLLRSRASPTTTSSAAGSSARPGRGRSAPPDGDAESAPGRRRRSSWSSAHVDRAARVAGAAPAAGARPTCTSAAKSRRQRRSSAAAVSQAEGRVRRAAPSDQARQRSTQGRVASAEDEVQAAASGAIPSRGDLSPARAPTRARPRQRVRREPRSTSSMPATVRRPHGRTEPVDADLWTGARRLWTAIIDVVAAATRRRHAVSSGNALDDQLGRSAGVQAGELVGGERAGRPRRRSRRIDAGREAPGIGTTTSACARCQASVTR